MSFRISMHTLDRISRHLYHQSYNRMSTLLLVHVTRYGWCGYSTNVLLFVAVENIKGSLIIDEKDIYEDKINAWEGQHWHTLGNSSGGHAKQESGFRRPLDKS